MPVSELEKKPERMISAARIEKSKPSGASFNAGEDLLWNNGGILKKKPCGGKCYDASCSVQHQLQHQLGTPESEH